jgi:hypothetical protein
MTKIRKWPLFVIIIGVAGQVLEFAALFMVPMMAAN